MSTTGDTIINRTVLNGLPTDDYLVGGWLVQPSLNRVARRDTAIHVRPQLIDVLTCLARRRGAVVSKDELLATVWSDRIVAESGIARCIAELRQLLADDAKQPCIIETIPKRGYRLIAPVQTASRPQTEPSRVTPLAPSAPVIAPSHAETQAARACGAAGFPGNHEPGAAASAMFSARAAVLFAAVTTRVRRLVG